MTAYNMLTNACVCIVELGGAKNIQIILGTVKTQMIGMISISRNFGSPPVIFDKTKFQILLRENF